MLVNMLLGKETFKRYKSKKTSLHASLIGNGLKKFQFGTIQMKNYDSWNLKSSYLNQLYESSSFEFDIKNENFKIIIIVSYIKSIIFFLTF